MKKFIICILFACCALPASAAQEGIKAGDIYINALAGAAATAGSYNYKPADADSNLDFGEAGPSYALQAVYFPSGFWGIGAEASGTFYQNNDYQGTSFHYVTWAKRFALMLVSRLNFNPQGTTRFYIPLGAGFNYFKGTIKAADGQTAQSSSEPSFYAGLGFETDISKNFAFGAEGRYNMFLLDMDKFHHTRDLSDIALLVKIGFKL